MIDGKTFELRTINSKDDGIIRQNHFSDGRLYGCESSVTASAIHIDAGYFIACGRQVYLPGGHDITVGTLISQGFLRLKFVVDLTKEPAADDFYQGYFEYETNTSNAFPALVQENINITGQKYETAFGIYSIAGGKLSGVVSQPPFSQVLSTMLDGQRGEYYKGLSDTAQAAANAALAATTAAGKGSGNDANSLPADGWYLCDKNIPTTPTGVGTFRYVLQVTYSSVAIMQTAFPYNPTGGNAGGARTSAPIFFRIKYSYSDTTGWNPWQPITIGNPTSRGSENDANNLPFDGWWLCKTNIPAGIGSYAYIEQITYINQQIQIAYPYNNLSVPTGVYIRAKYASTTWYAWHKIPLGPNLYAECTRTSQFAYSGNLPTAFIDVQYTGYVTNVGGFGGGYNNIVVPESGVYLVESAFTVKQNNRAIQLLLTNGGTNFGTIAPVGDGTWQHISVSGVYRMAANTQVWARIRGIGATGGTAVFIDSSDGYFRLSATKIGEY